MVSHSRLRRSTAACRALRNCLPNSFNEKRIMELKVEIDCRTSGYLNLLFASSSTSSAQHLLFHSLRPSSPPLHFVTILWCFATPLRPWTKSFKKWKRNLRQLVACRFAHQQQFGASVFHVCLLLFRSRLAWRRRLRQTSSCSATRRRL